MEKHQIEVGHLKLVRFHNKMESVQLINYFVVPTFLSIIYSSLIYGCQLERAFERGLEMEQTLARGCKEFAKISQRLAKRCKKDFSDEFNDTDFAHS